MGKVELAPVLTRQDIIGSYMVAEFVTLARDGSPVCWPLAPGFEHGRLVFSTGYMYPTKARNARRNPRVAALYSDPTASGRSDSDPLVLVQGHAEVFDHDIQRQTERYVDQLMRKAPLSFRVALSVPPLRRAMAGYLARIFIEVTPDREYVWARKDPPPADVQAMSRPTAFVPRLGISVPEHVHQWLPRYRRPPVLAYVDADGWPVATRIGATLRADHVEINSDIARREGAPACLTYHRLLGNYRANDSFLIRGHFDAEGRLIPEKIVGYGGTSDDRGLGSVKLLRYIAELGKTLPEKLASEGRPSIVPRPTPR
jgi:nitroimidazol reductase NimA-like FMN-containing flavoprotein (pyridoxamine 5'-phosphate oxidase superfamily)